MTNMQIVNNLYFKDYLTEIKKYQYHYILINDKNINLCCSNSNIDNDFNNNDWHEIISITHFAKLMNDKLVTVSSVSKNHVILRFI